MRRSIGTAISKRLPQYLRWSGVLIGLFIAVEVAFVTVFHSGRLSDPSFLAGAATAVPFLIGLSYSGYWLRRSDLSPSRYARIAGWWVIGTSVFVGINGALIVGGNESVAVAVSWLRWAVAVGGGTSVLIGIIEARTIEQAVTAERAIVRSENLERQRDLLDYLNSTLRHEVLNSATVIDGYTAQLLEEETGLDPESERQLEIVREEAADMATIVDDVRVLLRMTADDHELDRVHLEEILTDELRKVDNRWDVDVDLSIDTPADENEVVVRADEMLPRAFGNLLSNAVEHNDAATPRVVVDIERCADETVRVEIADNGSGIPEPERESLFERRSDRECTDGLGLFLVDELVTRYGGSVELVDTGTDGSTFAVELPCAAGEPDEPTGTDEPDASVDTSRPDDDESEPTIRYRATGSYGPLYVVSGSTATVLRLYWQIGTTDRISPTERRSILSIAADIRAG